jgi:shikimate dehydrogenase
MTDVETADLYAVIGFPISHSYSPIIHAQFAEQTGHRIRYERIESPAEEFAPRVREFFAAGGLGLNVTRPHKRAAVALADDTTPRARVAGAVNTLTALGGGRLQGDNTDGAGLVTDLSRNLDARIEGRRVLLLGAGGAARGIAAPLLGQRPAELIIANRDADKAVRMAADFAEEGVARGSAYDDLGEESFDIVINATAPGSGGEAPPLPAQAVRAGTLCYDLAYGQKPTPFTRWARNQGVKQVYKGWGMLVEQAAESYFIWRGVRPDTRPVLEKLAAWNRG